jgi:hypothetical protein
MEALERAEEREQFWRAVKDGSTNLMPTPMSNSDLEFVEGAQVYAIVTQKTRTNKEICMTLATHKILMVQRDINNLKKKLEGNYR